MATDTVHTFGFRAYSQPPMLTGASAAIDNIQLDKPGEETGVNTQYNKLGIQVYPTCMDSRLFVKLNSVASVELFIYDLNAQLWKKEQIKGSTFLNVESLPAGVYFCVMRQQGIVVFKQTVIKN